MTPPEPSPLVLRDMTAADLILVEQWLRDPEVARWYLAGTTMAEEIADLRRSVDGDEPTEALVVCGPDQPIGWCQYYRCDAYPDHAVAVGAEPDDIGIDYAIGTGDYRGRGVGTALIGTLVAHVRARHPGAGIVADPETSNRASRRVLERNGFRLLMEGPLASERTDAPMAVYRLDREPSAEGAPDAAGCTALAGT